MKKQPLLVFFVLLQAISGLVWACSCGPIRPPLKALAQADAVFSGEVTSIEPEKIKLPDGNGVVDSLVVNVTTKKSWKGNISGVVKVHTGAGGGDCGFPFEKGVSYLIYAARRDDGTLETNVCMRTDFLKGAATEILELEGRLPKPRVPSAPPTLKLIGRIDDAGYNGLIFALNNRLHDRIYLLRGLSNFHRVQVYEEGKWVDFAPNCGSSPRKELSPKEVSEELKQWKLGYEEMETEQDATYLDRLSSLNEFIAIPTATKKWRVGFQYVTEAEFDAGKEIQKSNRFIWSDAIEPSKLDAPVLTFEQAFQRQGFIPDPLPEEQRQSN